ncbi:MAG: hypothetical protein ABIA63_02590 [bacterium]
MNQKIIESSLKGLESIYNKIPPVPCNGQCKQICCVSPSCTLIEFIYLFRHILGRMDIERITRILLKPAELHPRYEGNLFCKFEEKGICIVHPGRTLACRLFGIPAMSDFKIQDLENCTYLDKEVLPVVKKEAMVEWLEEISALNSTLYSYYSEPYWLAGLNIECWLAVYFDPYLDDDVFLELKRILISHVDLEFLRDRYEDKTGLKEKMDKIRLLYCMLENAQKKGCDELLNSIRDNFPLTGTYYLKESQNIVDLLNKP